MPGSQSVLREYFRPVAALPCWHVTAEYGSWLSLRFGSPHLEIREGIPEARLKAMRSRAVSIEGDFLLWIELGAWELLQDGKSAFHSEQTRSYLRRAAARLDGQKLTQVKISDGVPETVFTFDFGSTLVVHPTHAAESADPLWHLYSDSRCLSLLASGELEYGPTRRAASRKAIHAGNISYAA
jgi:hypothetical protein